MNDNDGDDPFDMLKMVQELTNDEGRFLKVYDDATGRPIRPGTIVKGHPTIGIGRCLDIKGLSSSEVTYLLANDIDDYRDELNGQGWYVGLDPVRQRAIVNMRHQLGLAGLLSFHAMIEALSIHSWAEAATAARASAWFKETPARANRIIAMLLTGDGEEDAATVA